jgi:uncharacterized protein YutE (UPF0331/DUF86 family)
MARFRNLLVHGYAGVDLDLVADIVRNDLADLDQFAAAIRGRVTAREERGAEGETNAIR